ncbi:MAG: hypothetical protein ACLUD2_14425 [Clostridium sp.]
MRSSVMLLGPLLARLGRVETSLPGGCRIGETTGGSAFSGINGTGGFGGKTKMA